MKHDTREGWLKAAIDLFRPLFTEKGNPIPETVHVSCGWPSSKALVDKVGCRTLGEAWSTKCSKDGNVQIFISPCMDDPLADYGVLAVLAHELVHAAVGNEHGHKKPFWDMAKAIGLAGKPTATFAPPETIETYRPMVEALGTYPHPQLDIRAIREEKAKKKQGTRMIKCECAACGYIARTSQKWIDLSGPPLCACNREAMIVGGAAGDQIDEGGDE
jgi:hypothetical protein